MNAAELVQLALAATGDAAGSPSQLARDWQLQPATVTGPDAVRPVVVFDGDGVLGGVSTPVPVTSLIGHLAADGRAMILRIPPSGNYAIADLSGATSESDFSAAAITTTSGSFTTAGGALVGTSFIVPASGKVQLTWGGELKNSAGSFTLLAPQIAEGDTLGSGSVIVAASVDYTARTDTTVTIRATNTRLLTVADGAAFTPGKLVNVTLYHLVGGGTGTYERRTVTVVPVH